MKVEYLNHMGSDLEVCNDAYVSNDKRDPVFVPEKHGRLIAYLAREDHWTPFAHQIIKMRLTVPMYVGAQLKRHQIGFALNEVSRRYVDTPPVFEFPTTWRREAEKGQNKQGSSYDLPVESQKRIDKEIEQVFSEVEALYRRLRKYKVAKEQARTVLPVSTQTSWVWTASLYAWARLCRRRLHPHAQGETQEVARAIAAIAEPLFPVSWPKLVNAENLLS